jgi:hypothetical protein
MVIDDETTPTQENVARAKSAPPGEVDTQTIEALSFEAGFSDKGKVVKLPLFFVSTFLTSVLILTSNVSIVPR